MSELPPNQSQDDAADTFTSPTASSNDATSHEGVLQRLRRKLETIANEFAAGKLNPTQFNALYRHYTEKRMIIEKLVERNPGSDAWRSVAEQGQTGFLKNYFEARILYTMVFRHGSREPLFTGGKLPPRAAPQIHALLQTLWKMQAPRTGLARKSLGEGQWLVLAMGEDAMSIVVFSLQPSTTQINRVRDLHSDFERANKLVLRKGLPAKRMVFPQRALIEEGE